MISLPYPVSANRYWRRVGHRLIVSKEAEVFKRVAMVQCGRGGILQPITGPVEICIQLHPKMTKGRIRKDGSRAGGGTASKTCIDLDNVLKVTIDSLIGLAYHDDKQIHRLSAEIGQPFEGGGLSVWIAPLATGSIAPIEEGTA